MSVVLRLSPSQVLWCGVRRAKRDVASGKGLFNTAIALMVVGSDLLAEGDKQCVSTIHGWVSCGGGGGST